MYGLNAIALLALTTVHLLAAWLSTCGEAARTRALRAVCLLLLLLSVSRYALFPLYGKGFRVPVEYSSIAYFAVPIILLSGWKRLQSWAAYSGVMAGFFYYLTMVTAGGPVYWAYPPAEIYLSMYSHATLYLCGLVLLSTNRYSPGDRRKLIACTACVALWALLFRPLVEGTERFFIYDLLDGVYIRLLFPRNLWPYALPGYYMVLLGLVFLSMRAFFHLNRYRVRKCAAIQANPPNTVPAL